MHDRRRRYEGVRHLQGRHFSPQQPGSIRHASIDWDLVHAGQQPPHFGLSFSAASQQLGARDYRV